MVKYVFLIKYKYVFYFKYKYALFKNASTSTPDHILLVCILEVLFAFLVYKMLRMYINVYININVEEVV